MSVDQEARPVQITEPGVYDGMRDDVYHRDPVPAGSLSSTGARKLLPPSCPALFRHDQLNPPPPKATFDLGHAAHREVLGVGPDLVMVDRPRWDTNEVKAEVADIRAAGGVPLKRAEFEQVKAMAAALRKHPLASALLLPDRGKAEQSAFWVDDDTDVWRRARYDWLPNSGGGQMFASDYKTTVSAAPDKIQKTIHEYGYHQQAAWYLDGIKALGLAEDVSFVFIFQMKTAPYLVTVADCVTSALMVGRDRNRRALRTYRDCVASGHWPGFSDDVEHIALPPWAENAHYAEESTHV